MQVFQNIYSKKQDRDKDKTIISIILKYFVLSALFWIVISLFFYFYLYNPSYGTEAKLKLTSSYVLFFSSLCVIFLTLIFSALIGLVMSIPTIFIKIILIFKLERRQHRGQKPVILIFINKNVPIFILFLCNLTFLFFNFSVSPEIVANLFSERSPLSVLSKKLNQFIFNSKKENKFYEYGKKIGEKYPKDSKFIFFLPESFLNSEEYFKKTKLLLKYNSKILITNSYKTDTISSLFKFYPPAYYKLYAPVPFQSEVMPASLPTRGIYIGIDSQNSYSFYSLFNQFAKVEEIRLTWFDLFLNKFSFSQPQLLYFFKIGFAGQFNPLWKWPHIYNSNYNLLKKYAIDLIDDKDSTYSKFAFYLTGLEGIKQKQFITQYTKKDIFKSNDNNDKNDKNELKLEDLYLSQYIGGLISAGVNNVNLIPYLSSSNEISLHNFYSNNYRDNKKIYIIDNILLDNQETDQAVLNHTDIHKEESNLKNQIANKIEKIICQAKVLDFKKLEDEENLINKVVYENKFVFLNKKYEFYLKTNLKEGFICYLNDKSIYFIKRNYTDFSQNDFNYDENYSKLFQIYYEKSTYIEKEKLKNKIAEDKYQKLVEANFFNRFKIYKIDSNADKISIIQTSQEKELFLKKYGSEIIEEIFKYSTY